MILKLLTENHLKFLSLKGDFRGSSESTLAKMSNCWKSHAAAHFIVKVQFYLFYDDFENKLKQCWLEIASCIFAPDLGLYNLYN